MASLLGAIQGWLLHPGLEPALVQESPPLVMDASGTLSVSWMMAMQVTAFILAAAVTPGMLLLARAAAGTTDPTWQLLRQRGRLLSFLFCDTLLPHTEEGVHHASSPCMQVYRKSTTTPPRTTGTTGSPPVQQQKRASDDRKDACRHAKMLTLDTDMDKQRDTLYTIRTSLESR